MIGCQYEGWFLAGGMLAALLTAITVMWLLWRAAVGPRSERGRERFRDLFKGP